MFHCKKVTMKCPRYNATKVDSVEKSCAAMATADSKVLHFKGSPVDPKPTPIKPQCPPAGVTELLAFNNNTRAIHNKENSTFREHDGTLDEAFEDSGYLSLHNSQIDEHYGDEEDDHIQGKSTAQVPSAAATHQGKTISPKSSPSKCQGSTNTRCPVSSVETSSPVSRHRRTSARLLSSNSANLPILNFQEAVCEGLAKSYQKNKRYDWSIITKIAEDHLLDRVIGGKMGREYVDFFSALLARNMRNILSNILALLGDMDLISCKKVSKTWRKIICEETVALTRCQRAEQALRDSRRSLRQKGCDLTRDVAVSRVVLSCMQTLASSSTPSSSSSSSSSLSTLSCRGSRRVVPSQKSSCPKSQCTRFNEYMQVASSLKQHESLRSCKRCGSPAKHLAEAQRAKCTRPSCLFDFCTHCQEAFHGSTPCRVVQPRPHIPSSRSTPLIPGSARSKRSVRRL